MRYAFGDFVLDTQIEILFANEKRIDLEPKQYATLLLLCQCAGQIVTREQLLETSWPGIIVSDNTINKHIAVLRKILGDNAKSPIFIETVAKKGYRFIAEPELISGNNVCDNQTRETPNNYRQLTLLFTSLICLCVILFALHLPEQKSSQDIKTLTRMQGDKWSISFYQNDSNIIFINQKSSTSELIIQDINNQTSQYIEHDFDFISFVVGGINDEYLYVVAQRGDKDVLTRGRIIEHIFVKEEEIKLSNLHIFDLEYKSKDEGLYFIAQTLSTLDRGLYHVDFGLKNITPLYVPKSKDILLTRVDSKPHSDDLLLLGQEANSKSTLFTFSTKELAVQKIHNFNALVRDAIWQREFVLYTDTPPAQRVLKFLPNSFSKPQVIASSSEYLCCEMLLSKSTNQLIYRTNTTNYQIHWVGKSDWEVNNSTVYDMQPSLLHHSEGVVFVSKRSGKSQIYKQNEDSKLTALSQFSQYHVVRSMVVNPNDQLVSAIVDNQLLIFELNGTNQYVSKSFDNSAWLEEVKWLDDNHLVIKQKSKHTSRLEVYDKQLNLIQKLKPEWKQLFRDESDASQWYAIHESSGLVKLDPIKLLPMIELSIAETLNSSIGDVGKVLHAGSFFQQINKYEILQLNGQGKLIKTHRFNRLYGFDARDSKLMVSELKYQSSDWHAKSLN